MRVCPRSDHEHSTSTANPRSLGTFRVTGFVRFADGVSAARIKVVAFDRDLRSEQPLGETQTDRDGAYRIEYSERKFLNRERGTADLVVKALDADGSILVASPVLFNAPQDAEIDLDDPAGAAGAADTVREIESAVGRFSAASRSRSLEENQEHQDLTFLAGETGFEKRVLARFVLAHAWLDWALTGSSGSHYSAARSSSIAETEECEGEPRGGLEAPARRLDDGGRAQGACQQFQPAEIPVALAHRRMRGPRLPRTRRAACAGRTPNRRRSSEWRFEDAGIDSADSQAKFARLFNEHRGLTPEFADGAGEGRLLQERQKSPTSARSYQLAELTQGDFSAVKMLKEEFNDPPARARSARSPSRASASGST